MQIQILNTDVRILAPIIERWKKEFNGDKFGLSVSATEHMDDLYRLSNEINSDVLVAVNDGEIVGYMGMVKIKSPIAEQYIANEHYWYILPQHRGRAALAFIRAAMKWAKDHGCTHLMMNASTLASDFHDRTCGIYKALKMKHFETTYIAEI